METGKYIFLLIVYSFIVVFAQDVTYYTGAVVDFASTYDKTKTPLNNIFNNLNEYENFITKAGAQKVDIIVFPECGLTSIHLPTSQPELLPYSSEIPDPSADVRNPCEDNNNPVNNEWSTQIIRLSCAAQKNNIYVVANLVERCVNTSSRVNDDDLLYNTNIVFDRKGNLIARYRKFNLFVEPGFSTTSTAELIKFKTDFGVTFGTFICFDILFPKPALELLRLNEDVTDIVYPTAWFSELPFLTAVQTQIGWTQANGVNLLAAGYNNPEVKSGGSGIYPADGNFNYIMPVKHESSMIINKIPIIKKRGVSVSQHKTTPSTKTNSLDKMETLTENLKNYTTKLLNETISDYRLCHNEFCCVFDIEFNGPANADYYYRLIVYEGVRIFGILAHDVQICGVAACSNTTIESCGIRINNPVNSVVFNTISVKGDMFLDNNNSLFIPSFTDYELGANINYYFNVTHLDETKQIEMKNLNQQQNLLGFGIYGITESSASYLGSFSLVIALIVACFIIKFNY